MVSIRFISQFEEEYGKKLLFEYLTELSEFDEDIVFDDKGVPQYKWYSPYYFTDKDRYAFFLLVDGVIAGLCFVRRLEVEKYEMAEFYLKKEFRGGGNAIALAERVLSLFKGKFLISTRHKNVAGVKFWTKFVKNYNYTESQDGVWKNFIVCRE